MSGLTMAFLGDVYIAHQSDCPIVSQGIQDVLASCSHVVANLEGPITITESPIAKAGPVLRQSLGVLDLLRTSRVDLVGLANNHLADHGAHGIVHTLESLGRSGFRFAGAGLQVEEVYRPLRVGTDDATVSLLFGGERVFGCAVGDGRDEAGYAWLFHPRFLDAVRREAAQCDFVVVVAHGGVEHIDRPLPQWRKAYRQFIENGASAVVAHHPHLTQGYEVYMGAPIFFSIGNFFFRLPTTTSHWFHSQVPILRFQRNEPVAFRLAHTRFDLENRGHIVLDDSAEGAARTSRLTVELSGAEYERLLGEDLRRLWRSPYSHYLGTLLHAFPTMGFVKYLVDKALLAVRRGRTPFRANPMLVETLFECESHRWAIAEIMRMMYADRTHD